MKLRIVSITVDRDANDSIVSVTCGNCGVANNCNYDDTCGTFECFECGEKTENDCT